MIHHRPFYRTKRFLFPMGFLVVISSLILWYVIATSVSPPGVTDLSALDWPVTEPDTGLFLCNGNWLKKSNSGLWELYVQGAPFDRGVANGKLTRDLIFKQEDAFVSQIGRLVPSRFYRHFLRYFIYWFNRRLDLYLMEEFKQEIYGISFSASDSFDFIGSPYQRMMNYHSAHDIGHALQELMLVGCTSFGVWDRYSSDSLLLIGRNFDFWAGDAFAENRIVCFEKPDHGLGFMTITWGGMIGAVSGMNEKGITVTINAARSKVPFSARTPISLLAREILQYASSIDDAWQIACDRETFVSESVLIGSGDENRAVIIEKTPFGLALVEPEREHIICANHFQSSGFMQDPLNRKAMRDNASLYRYRRVLEDIGDLAPMDVAGAATLLRDQQGLNGTDIGMGNEKAVNQLIAHHSVIFKPGERRAWVSTSPWQLGPYVCYDLCEIFHTFATLQRRIEITKQDLAIPADPFLDSDHFKRFLKFREMRSVLVDNLQEKDESIRLDSSFLENFQATNPRFYEVYSLSGDYLAKSGNPGEAMILYKKALSLEIPRWNEKERIIRSMMKCNEKNKQLTE